MEYSESLHLDAWINIVTDTEQYIWSPFSGGPKKGILTPKIRFFKGLSPPPRPFLIIFLMRFSESARKIASKATHAEKI